MGYMRHHAIIVTHCDEDKIKKIHEEACHIFGSLVTPIIRSEINGYLTFFVAPDGSKEGWDRSNEGDAKREAFAKYLIESKFYASAAEVQYYDEEGVTWVKSIH